MDPADPIDRIEPADPMDATEPADPMDHADAKEPIDPSDSADPTELWERKEFMARSRSSDHHRPLSTTGAPGRRYAPADE